MDARGTMSRLGAIVLFAALLGVACSGPDEDGGGGGAVGIAPDERGGDEAGGFEAGTGLSEDAVTEAGGGGDHVAAPSDLPAVGPSIIKTADVSVEVPSGDFRSALQDATASAGRFGGFVVSTSTSGDESKTGTIVLRVPSEEFEAALASIEDLGEVKGEQVSGKDVTQDFVDLEARLRNLQAQESVLLKLMDEADSISASIRVQNSLSTVQLDIEQIQGRIDYLEDRSALSTIAVTLTEHGAPTAKEPGMLGRAWDNAVDVSEAVVYALVVSLGFVVPLALLATLVYVAIRLGMRVVRPRLGSGTAD